jgi:hypothetical protein
MLPEREWSKPELERQDCRLRFLTCRAARARSGWLGLNEGEERQACMLVRVGALGQYPAGCDVERHHGAKISPRLLRRCAPGVSRVETARPAPRDHSRGFYRSRPDWAAVRVSLASDSSAYGITYEAAAMPFVQRDHITQHLAAPFCQAACTLVRFGLRRVDVTN